MSRPVPDYPSFTFQSGYTVRVRLLGPQTQANIYLKVVEELADKKPTPPTEEINGVLQENDAHPDYLAAMRAFNDLVSQEVGLRIMRLLANYALIKDYDQSEIDEYKAAMDAIGTPITSTESDAFLYLWDICATSPDDIQDFMLFALNQGKPTAGRLAAHRESFSGDVPGARHLVSERPTIGPVA